MWKWQIFNVSPKGSNTTLFNCLVCLWAMWLEISWVSWMFKEFLICKTVRLWPIMVAADSGWFFCVQNILLLSGSFTAYQWVIVFHISSQCVQVCAMDKLKGSKNEAKANPGVHGSLSIVMCIFWQHVIISTAATNNYSIIHYLD